MERVNLVIKYYIGGIKQEINNEPLICDWFKEINRQILEGLEAKFQIIYGILRDVEIKFVFSVMIS